MNKKLFLFAAVFLLLSSACYTETVIKEGLQIGFSAFTPEMIQSMKDSIGVREAGKNYNVIIDGMGTGFAPPSLGQYEELLKNGRIVISANKLDRSKAAASYDNSTSDYFPPVGNQRYEGSCTCWSMVYYIKTYQEAMDRLWDLSGATYSYNWDIPGINEPDSGHQNKIMSPDFAYHQVNSGDDNGSFWLDIAELMEKFGACDWEKMPYDDQDHTGYPDEAAYRQSAKYRSDWTTTYIDMSLGASLETMRTLLENKTLLSYCIDANEYNFQTVSGQDLLVADSYPATTAACNHANTIVGFDDNFGPYWEGGQWKNGAFKVVNSWGFWGDEAVKDGYYYVSYAAMAAMDYEWCFYYYDKVDYEPTYIANIHVSHNARGDAIRKITRNDGTAVTRNFDDRGARGGNHAFTADNVILDISEMISSDPRGNYYFDVYDVANGATYPDAWGDAGTSTQGTITKFWIEDYTDATYSVYNSSSPIAIYYATDTPISTINGQTKSSYIYTNYAPVLAWSGGGGYTADGVEPNNGDTGDTFTFIVKYTDDNNNAPTLAQVWIDINDSGVFEGGEKFNMINFIASDYFKGGVAYSYATAINFSGDGALNYRFAFSDGRNAANGVPTSDSTVTVTPVGPYLSWLGTGNYISDGIDPQVGHSGTLFTFSVKFTESSNTFPDTYQVWIDLNDSSVYDNDEKFNMIENDGGDTDLTDGKLYSLSKNISYAGNGSLTYAFEFWAAGSEAPGSPAGNSTFDLIIPQATDLEGLVVYPNPNNGDNPVIFNDLTENTSISIYSIAGELVFSTETDSLSFSWYLKNSSGEKVASGIYFYVVSNTKGDLKKGKIAIII
ncbi:T9SS type A sorting domain-containing protein [bacterium]|nr:T9SS type A sorting domain-containing protein [bacterium]